MKLGVNIDHVATVREARYRGLLKGEPDPVAAALASEAAGAEGITAHLREDRRHIQDRDVFALKASIRTRLNLEMADIPEIVEIALKVRPGIVCLVPERRQEITTEGGLDVCAHIKGLSENRALESGQEGDFPPWPHDCVRSVYQLMKGITCGSTHRHYGTSELSQLLAGCHQ